MKARARTLTTVTDLVVVWVHTTAGAIKQVNILRHAKVDVLMSLAAGFEGAAENKIRFVSVRATVDGPGSP